MASKLYEKWIGSQKKCPTMLTLIEPVIRVNQFLGVCPHEITGEILVFRWNSTKLIKTIFTLCVLTVYFLFTFCTLINSMLRGKDMVTLGIISSKVTGTCIPIAVLVLTLKKRDQFTHFFLKVKEFKAQLKGIENCCTVITSARRFYGFYMFLALVSCTLTAVDSYTSRDSPVYFIQFFPEPTPWIRALDALFQFYITLVTHCACAVVEVLCATLSGSNVNKIAKIWGEMNAAMPPYEEEDGEDKNSFNSNSNGCSNPSVETQEEELMTVVSSSREDSIDPPNYNAIIIQQFVPPIIQTEEANYAMIKKSASVKSTRDGAASTKPILKAIRKFHCIAQIQALINCIFGPILALSMVWLVIEVCLLCFLEIRQLNPTSGREQPEVGMYGLIMIVGHAFVFTIRLLIVLISLGNLYESSVYFDYQVTGAAMKARKSKAQASDMNLIMVHLMRNQASPVAFSAGGLFVFSRATLLYAFSIVTTYVVFLLQA